MKNYIKIAITGGPSGGKTTFLETLKRELGQKCAVVPEAASILYRGGFPRYKEAQGIVFAQKAIYHTQHELEDMISSLSGKQLIVCDRGSIDGIAYWPEGYGDFFTAVQSDLNTELSRYDWVIHLDTASAEYYDESNPIRTENFQEASQLNSKIKTAWSSHPRLIVVGHNSDFFVKMTTCMSIVKSILIHNSAEHIKAEFSS